MSSSARGLKVLVIGLQGSQMPALLRKCPCGVLVRHLSLNRALTFHGDDSNLIIMTRFVSHKHEAHLRRVAGCSIIVLRHGTVSAILKTLESSLGISPEAAA